ncbi:hypothetical protein ACFRCQ_07535 [Cytobacillus firmus]|uniref:hypothetical protein n=1 Tax=Cytobacillus firmus TaxID=1399 RepID=UPI0036858FEB
MKNNNDVIVRRFKGEEVESLIERFNFRLKKHGKTTKLPQDYRFIKKTRKGVK